MNKVTKIFYIDDDQDDIEIVKNILSDMNEPMCSFHNVKDLMDLLENPPPHPSLIIIDMNMPRLNGIDVLGQIKESGKFSDIPIVMYSTTSSNPKVEQCKDLGANLYMIKGFTHGSIKKCFESILSRDWSSYKPTDDDYILDFN